MPIKRPIKPREKFNPTEHIERRAGREIVFENPPRHGWNVGPTYSYKLKSPFGGETKKGPAIRKTDPEKAKKDAKKPG